MIFFKPNHHASAFLCSEFLSKLFKAAIMQKIKQTI